MAHALPLTEPETCGFLYLAIQCGRPGKMPIYRQTATRRRGESRLTEAAQQLEKQPDVASVRVFRTQLVPPIPGAPRHDLALLIRTPSIDQLDSVRANTTVRALGGTELLAGANAARIGDTESDPDAHFLLNHFTVDGDADPVEAWLGLTNWYTATMRVDNSTALRASDGNAQFPLVNYVRLPSAPAPFLLNQLRRPSFHRVVRGTLKRNRMRALPGFYRMIR